MRCIKILCNPNISSYHICAKLDILYKKHDYIDYILQNSNIYIYIYIKEDVNEKNERECSNTLIARGFSLREARKS